MDDEYLLTSTRSPVNRVLRQQHGLTHSKSSSELTVSSHSVKVSASEVISVQILLELQSLCSSPSMYALAH